MVQQGQRLAFGFEPGDDLLGIHTRLDDFECYLAFDRLLLLGQIHYAVTTFTQDLQQFIGTNLLTRLYHRATARLTGRAIAAYGGNKFLITITRLRIIFFLIFAHYSNLFISQNQYALFSTTASGVHHFTIQVYLILVFC